MMKSWNRMWSVSCQIQHNDEPMAVSDKISNRHRNRCNCWCRRRLLQLRFRYQWATQTSDSDKYRRNRKIRQVSRLHHSSLSFFHLIWFWFQIYFGNLFNYRSAGIGAVISADYWWSLRQLRNYTDTNDEYVRQMQAVHERSAQRILRGCLKNGGLYVKLGQGLVNLDHILPKEYTQTLKVWVRLLIQRMAAVYYRL